MRWVRGEACEQRRDASRCPSSQDGHGGGKAWMAATKSVYDDHPTGPTTPDPSPPPDCRFYVTTFRD